MAKDPAFLFYVSDFLTGTMFMTNEQVGIYTRLLCSQHQHGGLIDCDSFNTLVGNNPLIKKKFIETEDGFYNERLAIEMEKRNKKCNNLSDAAKETWKKRKDNKIQLYNNSNTILSENDTIVSKNDTIVIQSVDVNRNKENNIITSNFKKENLLIPTMLKTWIKYEPDYFVDNQKDFPSLLEIAKNISKIIKVVFSVTENINEINLEWDEICLKLKDTDFIKDYNITQVEKHFSSVLLKIGKNKKKGNKIENTQTEAPADVNIYNEMY